MEVSYKHDVTHSFLVIQPDQEVDTKAYPIRMVLGNAIPGLLPCRLQKADGKILFYYEITARQRISEAYQDLTCPQLKKIYLGLLKIFEQMDAFLLDAGQLLLEPEYIYLDKADDTLYLCYLPRDGVSVREQLLRFTEYLLPHVEHQDPRGVMLAYGLYRLLMEDNFQMDAVGELLHRAEWEKAPEMCADVPKENGAEDRVYGDSQGTRAEEGDGTERESVWKVRWGKDLALLLAGVFFIGGSLVFRQMGYFLDISLPMLLLFLFCGLLLAALVVWNGRKKDEKKEETEERVEVDEEEIGWETGEEREGGAGSFQGEETVVLYRSPEYGCPVLVCEGTGQAPPIILDRDMVVVGKMNGVSDVLLDRPAISRVHARIQKKEQGYWIADLDSKNGTFVNGKRLGKEEEYLLQEDDLVVFADISYRFGS